MTECEECRLAHRIDNFVEISWKKNRIIGELESNIKEDKEISKRKEKRTSEIKTIIKELKAEVIQVTKRKDKLENELSLERKDKHIKELETELNSKMPSIKNNAKWNFSTGYHHSRQYHSMVFKMPTLIMLA
ncbi:hypothetical protein HJC23_007606 [Cyclotella cryptica]|uniref:Uncharacterized protein n=1 Tax=Cyclotella cryptica TaxID=29204 RepID=A0ABD3QS43_9STRA